MVIGLGVSPFVTCAGAMGQWSKALKKLAHRVNVSESQVKSGLHVMCACLELRNKPHKNMIAGVHFDYLLRFILKFSAFSHETHKKDNAEIS